MNTLIIKNKDDWPTWLEFGSFVNFLHENMKPYEDSPKDIERGLNHALEEKEGNHGFILLGYIYEKPVGAVVILNTGMGGYIPENIVLFACVHPDQRGKGLGSQLLKEAIDHTDGDVKLHVEYDNPAKKLYERLGFTNKYAEMRLNKD